jgi:hypothetical protein
VSGRQIFLITAHTQPYATLVIHNFENASGKYGLATTIEVRGCVANTAEQGCVSGCKQLSSSIGLSK